MYFSFSTDLRLFIYSIFFVLLLSLHLLTLLLFAVVGSIYSQKKNEKKHTNFRVTFSHKFIKFISQKSTNKKQEEEEETIFLLEKKFVEIAKRGRSSSSRKIIS